MVAFRTTAFQLHRTWFRVSFSATLRFCRVPPSLLLLACRIRFQCLAFSDVAALQLRLLHSAIALQCESIAFSVARLPSRQYLLAAHVLTVRSAIEAIALRITLMLLPPQLLPPMPPNSIQCFCLGSS